MRLSLLMAWNEVIQLLRIRTVILMLLGLPLLLIFLLGNALASDYEPVKLSAYIGDQGQIGNVSKQYLSSLGIQTYVKPRFRDSEEQVREDLRLSKADYGFATIDGAIHYYSGKYTERNMIAESVLNRIVAEINIHKSAAIVLPMLSQEQINGSMTKTATRDLIGNLVARDKADFNNFSAMQYYSVSYLIMFLIYSGMTGAIRITEEREKGTLLRLYSMPVSLKAMLFGKLLGILIFAFIQAVVIVAFTKGVYGVDWGTDYGGIAIVCVIVSIASLSFAIIITSLVRSRRVIESIFTLLIMVMTFLSGGMIADLSSDIREIGKYTLNHWADEALRTMMAGGTLQDNWHDVVILSSITAVLIGLSIVRIRKAVALS